MIRIGNCNTPPFNWEPVKNPHSFAQVFLAFCRDPYRLHLLVSTQAQIEFTAEKGANWTLENHSSLDLPSSLNAWDLSKCRFKGTIEKISDRIYTVSFHIICTNGIEIKNVDVKAVKLVH